MRMPGCRPPSSWSISAGEGYEVGITILKVYLAEVRPPLVGAKSYQRTSYLPGESGHSGWWEPPLSVPMGKGTLRKVFGLITTLPHSAAHATVFCFSKGAAESLPAFSGTLSRLGGTPEAVVVDRDPRSWCPTPVRLVCIGR